jgi:hypothetical protein
LALITVAAQPLLRVFAGQGYLGGAPYLPLYALGMTLMGAAAVLIATHQSRGGRAFLNLLLPIAVLEPVLILLWHESPIQVVLILDGSVAVLLLGLLGLLLAGQRGRAAAASAENRFTPTAQPLEAIR